MKYTYDFADPKDRWLAISNRWGALKNERANWIPHWQDISRHVLPRSGRFFTQDRNKGGKSRYNDIFDNTATRALRILGAGMQAGTTNPARPWFKLSTVDPDLADYHPVAVWLSEVTELLERVFARSNTYRALHQSYEELGAFGTAASVVLPDFDSVLHHYPVTCGLYALQQDMQGRVVAFYREIEKTVGETVKEFGIENCSPNVQTLASNRELEAPVTILHAIEPREDQARTQGRRDALNMPFKSCYMDLSDKQGHFLRESGFEQFPVLAPRWQIAGGDVYGHGPGMEALGDIRQLQQETLNKGRAVEYGARPPLQRPPSDSGRGSSLPGGYSYLRPGTMTEVHQTQAHGWIRPAFEPSLRLDWVLESIRDSRERINGAFHADLFLMLASAGHNTQMTATEVAERHEEKLLALGPVLMNLQNELHQPMIEIGFNYLEQARLLPPPPPELQGQDLSVEFIGLLAQAQKAIGVVSQDRFMGNVLNVAQVRPEVLDKVNFDFYVDDTADRLGIDPKLVVPDEDVAALRQARAQQEAAQAQVAAMREQAATAKDLAAADLSGDNALAATAGAGQELMPL